MAAQLTLAVVTASSCGSTQHTSLDTAVATPAHSEIDPVRLDSLPDVAVLADFQQLQLILPSGSTATLRRADTPQMCLVYENTKTRASGSVCSSDGKIPRAVSGGIYSMPLGTPAVEQSFVAVLPGMYRSGVLRTADKSIPVDTANDTETGLFTVFEHTLTVPTGGLQATFEVTDSNGMVLTIDQAITFHDPRSTVAKS